MSVCVNSNIKVVDLRGTWGNVRGVEEEREVEVEMMELQYLHMKL